MPTDFSHITAALKAIGYRHAINRGDRVTDEMFHDAVSALSPPPLPDGLMAQLLEELDEKIARKPGRPPTGAVTRKRLASAIEGLPNERMTELLRHSLVSRLVGGLRYTEFERSVAFQRRMDKRTRNMIIRGLHRDFTQIIRTGRPLVHEILGPIDESCALEYKSPSHKSLAIVPNVMRTKFGEDPPSMRRMQNIIYQKPKRKTCTNFPAD
jgi:hypothetical protein